MDMLCSMFKSFISFPKVMLFVALIAVSVTAVSVTVAADSQSLFSDNPLKGSLATAADDIDGTEDTDSEIVEPLGRHRYHYHSSHHSSSNSTLAEDLNLEPWVIVVIILVIVAIIVAAILIYTYLGKRHM